ncbi:MAG: hypothetical protein WHS46_01025 [Desulfosoma sp.]
MEKQSRMNLEGWKAYLEQCWDAVPKVFRSEKSLRRTLQCALYAKLSADGLLVVADYLPPRADRPVDLIVLNGTPPVVACAVCFDDVVTLYAVKSLSSFEAGEKVIFTTGPIKKKVEESRFFLKPGIQHVHLEWGNPDSKR